MQLLFKCIFVLLIQRKSNGFQAKNPSVNKRANATPLFREIRRYYFTKSSVPILQEIKKDMTQRKLEIIKTSWLNGPNIWTYRPCIEALINIHDLEQAPSNLIPGLYESLTTWLPNLAEHRCGIGEKGGFLERLRDGTYAAHILEHVVIELHEMIGQPVGFGKARMTSKTGIYKMVFRTTERRVGMACLHTGMRLLQAAIDQAPFDMPSEIKALKAVVDKYAFGPSTQHILDAAYERRIPFIRLTEGNLVQLGYGERQQRIWTAESTKTSAIAEGIASDKHLCKELISLCGVPIPEGEMAESPEKAWEIAQDIGLPVVVKPSDANHGRGVSLELSRQEDIEAAWHIAAKEGSDVLVEQFIRGNEHRVLVINGEVAAVARGEIFQITGDGKSTVTELIESQINTDPRRGEEEEYTLTPVDLTKNLAILLEIQRQGYQPDSVVPEGQQVIIERNSNATLDVTDSIHPDIARLAALAAKVVHLDIAGIDLVCEHIDQPPEGQSIAVIEVNAGPGLLMHIKPSNGPGRNIGEKIIESLFPEPENGRIPIVNYLGGDELKHFGTLLHQILTTQGRVVGLACDQGLWIGDRHLKTGDATDFESGRRMLISKRVNTAIAKLNMQTLLEHGIPYDRCHVSVVTSLGSTDGLEPWDIQTSEQLFNSARTAVDLVLTEGHAILNADEVGLLPLRDLCDGQIIWISRHKDNPVIQAHLKEGGRAVVIHRGMIECLENCNVNNPLIEVPVRFPEEESLLWMALTASAWSLNLPKDLIESSMQMALINTPKVA